MDFLNSYIGLIPVTMAQSLIYAFVATGIMLPFRILSFPDLTSEGAFPLGGCVCGVLLSIGVDPLLAMTVAAMAGFAAGCTTAFVHLRFGINTLLAGILVMTMLYSINLRIMGRSNIALFNYENIFSNIHPDLNFDYTMKIPFLAALIGIVVLGFFWFFKTEKGVGVRAVGANPEMAEAQGINIWTATIGGVGIASALSAFGGALLVQSQGFADVNMGFGILINGLAALIIGEAIIGRNSVLRQLLAPVVGAMVYYQLVSFCLALGLPPSDLKLATGAFVLIMLALPTLKKGKAGAVRPEKLRE